MDLAARGGVGNDGADRNTPMHGSEERKGWSSEGAAWPQLPKQLPELRLLAEHPRFLKGTGQERLQRSSQPFPGTGQPPEPQQSRVGPHQQADEQGQTGSEQVV
ncbi:MAG: hypothetical protein ACK559_32755, partial [bacterium]